MPVSTRDALLRSAGVRLRTKGYSAFSYADLSEEIGIRKASIHHHFATKESLGEALVTQHIALFTEQLKSLDAMHADPVVRLREFSRIFLTSINDQLLPLCGALAAEMAALPESLQVLGRGLLSQQLAWLETCLVQAARLHGWTLSKPTQDYAFMLLSALEGVSFVAWALGRPADPLAAFNHILDSLG